MQYAIVGNETRKPDKIIEYNLPRAMTWKEKSEF